jgi:hypothetical protein
VETILKLHDAFATCCCVVDERDPPIIIFWKVWEVLGSLGKCLNRSRREEQQMFHFTFFSEKKPNELINTSTL